MDLAGSMSEWVFDAGSALFPAEDPCDNCLRTAGSDRVVRGGAWHGPDAVVERGSYEPEGYDYELGFRCARSP